MNPDDMADLEESRIKVRLQAIGDRVIEVLYTDDIDPTDGAAVLGALFCSLMAQSCKRREDIINVIDSLKETSLAAWEKKQEKK